LSRSAPESKHESPIGIRLAGVAYRRRGHGRDGPLGAWAEAAWHSIAELAFLGRWIGHLPRGQGTHDNITRAALIRGELWIGWCAHYSIGVTFAALLLAVYGLEWARKPTVLPALGSERPLRHSSFCNRHWDQESLLPGLTAGLQFPQEPDHAHGLWTWFVPVGSRDILAGLEPGHSLACSGRVRGRDTRDVGGVDDHACSCDMLESSHG
jgi:hypothetical protein